MCLLILYLLATGEANSTVFGSLIDGVFEGRILSPKGDYFVEKAHHYFPHHTHPNQTFHSVIYHDDHVIDAYQNNRTGESNQYVKIL